MIVVFFVPMRIFLAHQFRKIIHVVNRKEKMANNLIRTGAIGSILAAVCCFTPVLVWMLSFLGLAALISYLDYILLPLLMLFIILLVVGFIRKDTHEKDKT